MGAGVQSTTIALMVVRRELPPIDAAVFADPQEEGTPTYRHLDWLEKECDPHFPLFRDTRGKLGDHLLRGQDGQGGRFASIPAFTKAPDGSTAVVRRQCTKEYKTSIVERAIRYQIVGLQPRQRMPKGLKIRQWIGLSFDEPSRVARTRDLFAKNIPWAVPWFPLFDMQFTRGDCQAWLQEYGIPHTVPRSACVFCPYKDNSEWLRLQTEDPEGWQRALEIDQALRTEGTACARNLESKLYLHRSCVPLGEAVLNVRDERVAGTSIVSFDQDCEGMCWS